jgi:hypothetical protein
LFPLPNCRTIPSTSRLSEKERREISRVASRTVLFRKASTSSPSNSGSPRSKRYEGSTPKTLANAATWPTVGSMSASVLILSTSSSEIPKRHASNLGVGVWLSRLRVSDNLEQMLKATGYAARLVGLSY